nr:MAG TPA: hemolysin [Caudoviricetes sp.]
MAEDITARVSVLEEKIKVSNRRIEDLEDKTDRIENLTLSVQKLAISVEQMAKEQVDYRAKQDQIANKLIELEQQPSKDKAKKVDSILTYVMQLVVAAIVGAVLAYIGLQV